MTGLTSIEPESIGTLPAHVSASSRFSQSSRQKPPSCSFDSANGPSVTIRSPSGRTRIVVATELLSSGSHPISAPLSVASSSNAAQRSSDSCICSGEASSMARSSTMNDSRYFIVPPWIGAALLAASNLTTNGGREDRQRGGRSPHPADELARGGG